MVTIDNPLTDHSSDELLATLCTQGPDYGPVLAFEAGMDTAEAERRLRSLQDHGLVERVSEEPCYRATDRGEETVRDVGQQRTLDPRPTDFA